MLEFVDAQYRSLADVPLDDATPIAENAYAIDLSGNALEDFSAAGCSNYALDQLAEAQIVIAQRNYLVDLTSVPHTFPALVALDVSGNDMAQWTEADQLALAAVPTLDTLLAGGNRWAAFDVVVQWEALRVLDLTRNALREVPDVAACENLATLDISHNHIGAIAHADGRLPPRLEQLDLGFNQLDDWWHLPLLTCLAETLREVTLGGNPFCDTVRFSWRILLGWLLPALHSVDGLALTDHEQDAVRDLFREGGPSGAVRQVPLSLRLVCLMDEGREQALEEYLDGACRVQVRKNHPHRSASGGHASSFADPVTLSTSRAPSTPPLSALPPPPSRSPRSAHGRTDSPAPTPTPAQRPRGAHHCASDSGPVQPPSDRLLGAVSQLQHKVRTMQDVVKALWQQDLVRRHFAAVLIQRHWRGAAARRRVPKKVRLRLAQLACCQPRRGGGVTSPFLRPVKTQPPRADAEFTALRGEIDGCVQRLAVVEVVAAAVRQRAAKTIQRFYRGHVARRTFRKLKAAYAKFTRRYVGPATIIQATVRMHQQRKRFIILRDKEREMRQLRESNKALSARVSALEKAFQNILARMETVEQLSLLAHGGDGDGSRHGGAESISSMSTSPAQPSRYRRDM